MRGRIYRIITVQACAVFLIAKCRPHINSFLNYIGPMDLQSDDDTDEPDTTDAGEMVSKLLVVL